MNTDTGYIPAGTTIEPHFKSFKEVIKEMEETTEKTFEFSILHKDRNLFWILYMTDKLSDNWGFTVMLWDWTLINFTRKTKWWRKRQKNKAGTL